MYARRGRVCIHGLIVACGLLVAAATDTASQPALPVRVGVIGLDTSHSPAFTKVFNDPQPAPDVAGFRVTVAYPFGSRKIESSYSRIPKFSEEVRQLGVEIVDSIAQVLRRVDVVLLMTNDGRLHLDQARQVLHAGKPIFIDKPLAASLADAVATFERPNGPTCRCSPVPAPIMAIFVLRIVGPQTSSTSSPARSAFAAAMIFV